jgi:hypothetical protein
MSDKSLNAQIRDLLREFKRQHKEVATRTQTQRVQSLPYAPEDVKRLGELNALINPLERVLEALNHAGDPNPADFEKISENVGKELERLEAKARRLQSDDE